MRAGRHCGDLGRGRLSFRDGRFCQCPDAIDHLSRIEATVTGKALPVPPGEVIASAFAGDRLSEALGDAAPKSSEIPWLTWEQSSRQLLDTLLDKRGYRYWPDKDLDYSEEAPGGLQSDGAQLPLVAALLKSN